MKLSDYIIFELIERGFTIGNTHIAAGCEVIELDNYFIVIPHVAIPVVLVYKYSKPFLPIYSYYGY